MRTSLSVAKLSSTAFTSLTITDSEGRIVYRNAWITDFLITQDNFEALAAFGRARWKIENENNNVFKTKGYHLEHNFGHGKKHLASVQGGFEKTGLMNEVRKGVR